MKVSVLMACYYKRKYLEYSLGSLARQSRIPDEVIIAIDDTGDLYKTKWHYPFEIKVFSTGRHHDAKYRTSAHAFNEAIKRASGDICVLCSPETLHGGRNIELITNHLLKSKKSVVVSQRFYFQQRKCVLNPQVKLNPDTVEKHEAVAIWKQGRPSLDHELVRQDNMTTGIFGTHKSNLLAIGGFDKNFSFWGGNDINLLKRLQLYGLDFVYSKRIFGIHLWHKRPPQYHMQHAVPLGELAQNPNQFKAKRGI